MTNPTPDVPSTPTASPDPSAATSRPDASRQAHGSSAWTSGRAWATMVLVCVLSVAIDLESKVLAFRHVAGTPVQIDRAHVLEISRIDPRSVTSLVPHHEAVVVVPHVLHFTLVLNPGAVFGMGPGQRWFFVGFTLLALGFGLLMFAKWTAAGDRFAHIAIGLLVGGGLGNLYDRLAFGCVRDFLHPLPGLKWPRGWMLAGTREIWPYVSNLADLFLLIGILMLLVHLWRRDRAMNN